MVGYPFVIAFVGASDTGKTTLILKLLPKFKRDGFKVAVVKHCPHGFELNREGKDSWKFTQAGADGVVLTAPNQLAIIRTPMDKPILDAIEGWFADFDRVLMEGFGKVEGIKKINLLRKGVSEKITVPYDELLCVVADFEVKAVCPSFFFDDVEDLYRFIVSKMNETHRGTKLSLIVNHKDVKLNKFVQDIIGNVILGMVKSLKLETKDVRDIRIVFEVGDS